MPIEVDALVIRGGTSKGVFFLEETFPFPRGSVERDDAIRRVFGVPDKTGMQLDGLGGGISSTSKVVFVSKSRKHCEVDYDFGQVGMKSGQIDWTGNCGNLTSALLVASKQFGLIPLDKTNLQVWQVNVQEEMLVEEMDSIIEIPGVPGRAQAIGVTFKGDPSKLTLPTGNVVDDLSQGLLCTLLQGSNPTVFLPTVQQDLNDEEFIRWTDQVRSKASEAMNIPLTDALRACFVQSAKDYVDSSGKVIKASEYHVFSQITTPGRRFHHAMTGTGAVNLALAAKIPGTIVNQIVPQSNDGSIRIGHPGGILSVQATVFRNQLGQWRGTTTLMRTARLLMKGKVVI